MKYIYKKLFKSYMEAYDGYSKCWYMYYTTRPDDNYLNR